MLTILSSVGGAQHNDVTAFYLLWGKYKGECFQVPLISLAVIHVDKAAHSNHSDF